jgi:hypothetical protein
LLAMKVAAARLSPRSRLLVEAVFDEDSQR